jgi:translocation and assembly module TamB
MFRESGDIAFTKDAPVGLGLQALNARIKILGQAVSAELSARGDQLGSLSGVLKGGLEASSLALDKRAPLEGRFMLSMPQLEWLGPLSNANLKTAGSAQGEITLAGTPAAPIVRGHIQGQNLMLAMIDQGLRLSEGQFALHFNDHLWSLERLRFAVPVRRVPTGAPFSQVAEPGEILLRGTADLKKRVAELDLRVDRAVLSSGSDRYLMASGQGTMYLRPEGAKIQARSKVDAAWIAFAPQAAQGLSEDVVLIGSKRADKPRFALEMDLQAELGEQCYLQVKGLQSRLIGQLRVRSEDRAPFHAIGAIQMIEGSYDAYGQTLAIERGLVNFQGPLDNPLLNVRAFRRGLPVEAGVEVTGYAKAPRVRLISEPPVADSQKLSWLVLGRGLDQPAGGGSDSAVLLAAAAAILGDGEGASLPQKIAGALGLDEIKFAPSSSSQDRPTQTVAGSLTPHRPAGMPSTLVQVGKRLSSRAYLSYEHSLLGLESVVKLSLMLSRRLSLVGRAGTNQSIDLLYTFSFD